MIEQHAAERAAQRDRHVAQLIQAAHDNLARMLREKEIEDRRQFERILDKFDRMRNGGGQH